MTNKYGLPEYDLRKSQQEACDQFIKYITTTVDHNPSFCFNAVMRWGKCLTSLATVYYYNQQVAEDKKIKNVLILTFFPAVEDSWSRLFPGGCEAQQKFDNFNFISLRNNNQYDPTKDVNVFFSSFQEIYTGKSKKNIFYEQSYDLLILDEYHYGAYNNKAKGEISQFNSDVNFNAADVVLNDKRLQCRYRLTLTGTPYRLFSNNAGEFNTSRGNLFRFTYFDEQLDRLNNGPNSDYKTCPPLNLYSVNIKTEDTLENRIDFLMNNTEIFGDDKTIPMFTKPGSASFWLIESVKIADDIEKYINIKYPGKYNIINLYCKGKNHNDALREVRDSLNSHPNQYSIILSYNKLTLGVTVPRIDSVVFLRDISTPELYMQAACRSKSQYTDHSKNTSYLISFNLMNDYSIFQQITKGGMSEKDFLRTLPINEVNYDPISNSTEIRTIDDSAQFLNALADVPISQAIDKSVSSHIEDIIQIPINMINELLKVAGICDASKNKTLNKLVKDSKDPIKRAEHSGKRAGYNDKKEEGYCQDPIIVPKQFKEPLEQEAYRKGYMIGQQMELREAKTPDEKDHAESKNIIIEKIKILTRRFVYILIADYFSEGKFLDLNDPDMVSIDYFAALLGFGLDENGDYCPQHGRETFMRLYYEGIFNQDIINQTVIRIKANESGSTRWIGLSNPDEFDLVDELESEDNAELSSEIEIEEIVEEEPVDDPVEEEIVEKTDDVEIDDVSEEPVDEAETKSTNETSTSESGSVDNSSQRFIYIAKRSSELEEEIANYKEILRNITVGSILYNNTINILKRKEDLVIGVKIGQTNRLPEERLEELNGYLLNDQKPLLEIATYREVPNNISDRDFHEYLISKGYSRIADDHRVEYFNIPVDKAIEELDTFLATIKPTDKVVEKVVIDDPLYNQLYDLLLDNPDGMSVKQMSRATTISRGKIRNKLREYPKVFQVDCAGKYYLSEYFDE